MTTYTVAFWQANQSTLDSGPSFTITDTASDISGAFDALDLDLHITQLIVSDNAAVTVSTNQLFVSDTHAIGILKNANNSAYTLVVSDTGANITTYLNNLQTNTHVTTIVVASGVVDATVAQLASDSTALANLKTSVGGPQASVTVSDTSAHIHSGWANVAADSQVSSIVISDNTQVSLTATQASQTAAVDKLVFANTATSDIVLVKDTAAHIEADLTQLNSVASFISSVTVSDSTFETLSASQVTSDLAILEKTVFQSGPASFSVSDSSANVSANLDALESLSGSITSIAVTDNSPITVSLAQLADDSDALSLITFNSNPISVAVADTGSNISGNLATLEAAIQAASPPITSISVTSGVINTTVTQLTNDSAVFSALTGSFTLNVSDTASNISGALDTLQTFAHNGDISAINVTDSGNIAVTVAQITSDATAISELVDNDTNPYTLAVTDSAAHIQAAFSSIGTNSHIAAVTFTDATPVLTITASQFINGVIVLGEITNAAFTIDVTGATAGQAATIATDFAGLPNEGSATLSIAVSDTATHISSNLVALGSNTYVSTIAVIDSNPLSLTEVQFSNAGDDAGLAKMTGTYTVHVTGVTVAQVPTVEGITGLGGTPTLSIAVSDTASNVGGALSTLGSDNKVTSIAVNDSNPITLTEAQFTLPSDGAGLAKMTGSYTVDVTGATVAQVSAVESVTLGGTPTLSIAVSDAGGSFTSSALQSLGADNDVTSIAVTSGIVSLNVTPFTTAADDAGFAKFVGAYTVQVLGASVAQVATVEGVSLPGTPTLQIWVSDSGTNITDSALQTLGADSKVIVILVSDSNPITLTEAQFTGGPEEAGLAKLSGFYTVDVTGVTVAQVSTVEGVFLPGSSTLSIAVSDIASNIAGALSTLGGDSSVTSIAVSDSNPLSLAEAAFVADSAGLAKMTGSYTVDVTGVTVAQVSAVEGVHLGGTPTLSIAVSDTAAAIEVALSTLGSDGNVTSIALSNPGTIALTEGNYTSAAYDAGLAKMTGSYIVDVQGVTVAQVAAVEAVTGLGGTPTVAIEVRDTGANLTSAALVSLGSDSEIADIALSGGSITLTEAQYTNSGDQAGLAKMMGAYTVNVTGVTAAQVATVEGVTIGGSGTPTLSIAVTDTGSNITGPYLGFFGIDSKVTSIAISSGAITLTQALFLNASADAGLAKMTGAYTVDVAGVLVTKVAAVEAVHLGGTPTLSIAVSDIGARFTGAELTALGADSKVTSITVTSGAVTLTEAQFVATGEHAGLAKLIGSYTVDVTGVTVAQVPTVEAVSLPGTPTLSIAVSDTGANLSSFEMGILGSDSHVTSIAVTGGALTFNESQFTSSGAGFAKMTGAYTVDVSGVTVAQVSAVEGASLAGTPTLSIAVSDTGLNIAGALGTLGSDSHVTSIAVSDANPITITEAAFVSDSAGLAKMAGTYGVFVTGTTVAQVATVEGISLGGAPTLRISVADTAAHVGNAESTLNADAHVTSITVSDTAANISTYIDQLAGLTNLTHVTVNDGGILNLTYTQFTTDSHAFNVMSETGYPNFFYNVVGATLAQAYDVYFNHLNYIGSNGRFENVYVVDTAANIANGNSTILDSSAAIQINDTAANVSTYLDGLQAIQSHLIGTFAITLSDPTDNLVVTEAQLTSDATVIHAITNSSFNVMVTNVAAADVGSIAGDVTSANSHGVLTTMTVSDSGANFTDAALQAIGSNSAVTSATVTGGIVQLTEAQFTGTAELAGLAKMTGSYSIVVGLVTVAEVPTVEGESLGGSPTLSINVQDVGSAITSTALSTLGADSKISHISVSSGTLTLTESQFTDSGVDAGFGKMNGSYTVAVTGVLASQVAAAEAVPLNGSPTLLIAVSDAGGNLTAAKLTSLGSDPNVTSITTSSPITLTEAQFTTSGVDAGLAKVTGAYTVNVTGVTAAQVATVEGVTIGGSGTPTLSIAVTDTGSNITGPYLGFFGIDSKVTSIAISSGAITLTQALFLNASADAGLAKMTGAYTVDVAGVLVTKVAAVEAVHLGGTPTLSIAVSDIGARFTGAELTALGADSKVTSITVTSGAVTLTEAQFVATGEHAGLHKITGAYTVDVTNVVVAKVATVEAVTGLGGTPTLSIAVNDSGTNLTSAALASLGADSKVTSIAVTSNPIVLTEAQFVAAGDLAGLAKMTGAYTVDVLGVGAAQVATVEGAGLGGTPTLSIAVSDIGANITSARLVSFGADTSVTSIAVTGGAITLTEAQFTAAADDAGLFKITSSYTVDVTGVTVANVATVEAVTGLGGTPTISIAVSDIGGNITSSALSTLGADNNVTSVAVTSGAIALTEAQFVSAADHLGLVKMTGSYAVDVSGVTAARVGTVEGISLGGTPNLSIAVRDVGSNITSAALVSLGADSKVTSIAAASGAISLTETQFTAAADDAGLAKMTGTYTVDVSGVSVAQVSTVEAVSLGGTPTLSIAVSDTGGNLTGAALINLGSDPHVRSIAVSSGAISLTETQFTTAGDDAGLAKLTGPYTVDVTGVAVGQVPTVEGISLPGTPTLSIAVRDIGSNITDTALQLLGADTKVTSIAVTSGVIALTGAQYTAAGDDAALAKMTGAYTVDVSGVSVAQVSAVEAVSLGGSPTLSIAVVDASSNITDAALKSLGADTKVTSISVINGEDANTLAPLTEAQFTGAAEDAGLAKMTGSPYTVDVTGVSVANVTTVEAVTGLGGTPTLSLAVVDVGANFTSAALTSLGSDTSVASIAVSSGAISLSEAHFVVPGVDVGLGKMTGAYTVDVTGTTVAQVSTVEGQTGLGGTPTLSITVSDVAGSITDSVLQSLGADNDVTSIAVTSGALALTAAQFLGAPEDAGLAKMTGHYTVDVSGASVTQVPTIEGTSIGGVPTLSITVSDVGSQITSAALVNFGGDNDVTSITDSSGAIVLTESQFTNANDDAGLAKMIGSYTVDVSGVSVANVSTVEGLTGLGGTPTLSIAVGDTGAHITDAALQSLGADSDVATISDTSGAITLTESQFTGVAEGTGLAKMTGSYTVDVSAVTVGQVTTVEAVIAGGTPTLSIAVSDAGTNITSAALASFGSDSDVTSIADTNDDPIILLESEFTADAAGLSKMTGPYTVAVLGVSVAQVATVEGQSLGGTPTLSIDVVDIGLNLTSAALVSLGADNHVTSINDLGSTITLTEAQFITSADQTGLEKIFNDLSLDVTNVTTAQVSTVTTDFANLTNSSGGTLAIYVSDTASHVANAAPQLNTAGNISGVAVTDTAAHVTTWLDILNGVEALNAITLTDVTPVLTLTESTFVGGLLALDTIQNTGVTMNVTNSTAAQAASVAGDFTSLTDDANFGTFAIAVADNSTNVASNASALNANSYVTAIHVTDNQANIDANIDALENVTALTAVTLTNASPVLSLTATQVLNDSHVLSAITNGAFTIDASGATVVQATSIVGELTGLSDAGHITYAIGISDVAASISAGLNGLENDNVNSLTISDSQPLNITYAEFQNDGSVLSKLTGTDTVNVTGVTGQAYGSFTDTYVNGSVAETVENNTNGSTSVIGYVNGLTFQPAGPSGHVESITVTNTHQDTFIFAGSFGNDSVTGFNLANDMIQFSSAEFANVAAVELHTTQVGGNAVVTLDSGDTITMVGISMASFEAHSNDWSFT